MEAVMLGVDIFELTYPMEAKQQRVLWLRRASLVV
jgi:hypothetical protein